MNKGLIRLVTTTILILIALWARPNMAIGCLYDKCFNTRYGSIHYESITRIMEVHGYALDVAVGDALIIRACNLDRKFNPKLQLISPQGNTVVTAGIPGTGMAEFTTRQLNQAGTYTITVSDFDGNGRGNYYLTVQSTNRPGNPRPIAFEQVIRDTLIMPSELGVFQFNGLAGEMISIRMIEISADLEPQVRLYDSLGGYVAGDVDYEYALIANRVLPLTGKYTIITNDDIGDDLGEYFLILSRIPTDAESGNPAGGPTDFALYQNSPNPFNPQTMISFNLPRSSFVALNVYNILGENVRTLVSGPMTAGRHAVYWDGRDAGGQGAPSGIYIYRLEADEFIATRKMLLLR